MHIIKYQSKVKVNSNYKMFSITAKADVQGYTVKILDILEIGGICVKKFGKGSLISHTIGGSFETSIIVERELKKTKHLSQCKIIEEISNAEAFISAIA